MIKNKRLEEKKQEFVKNFIPVENNDGFGIMTNPQGAQVGIEEIWDWITENFVLKREEGKPRHVLSYWPNDMRQGQAIFNFLEWLKTEKNFKDNQSMRMADPFFIDSEEFENLYLEFINKTNTPK